MTYEASGVALGILDDTVYEQHSLALPRGGTAASVHRRHQRGHERPEGVLRQDRVRRHVREIPGGPRRLGQHLIGDVRQFAQGSSQADDMCVVCFGRP